LPSIFKGKHAKDYQGRTGRMNLRGEALISILLGRLALHAFLRGRNLAIGKRKTL